MTNTNIWFTINNIEYIENTANGYCYKVEDGKKSRISRAVFMEAMEQYTEEKAEEQEIKEEAKKQKKASKKRVKKNAAYKLEINGETITLTEKQKVFFENIPNDQYYDGHGEDAELWTDAYCDTLAGVMNAMVVGAIISTLREKDLIYIGQSKVNGKKCKFFGLTDLGKAIFRDMGL